MSEEMQERTVWGGLLSIISVSVIVVLFFLELQWFNKVDRRDEVIIDQSRGPPNVTVDMSIRLHRVPCAMAYLNVLDNRLSNSLGVHHEIIKTRIDENGGFIEGSFPIRDGPREVVKSSEEMVSVLQREIPERDFESASVRIRCGSCFGVVPNDLDHCCASCDDVKNAWSAVGKQLPPPDVWVPEQCMAESYKNAPPQEAEGCDLSIKASVPRGSWNMRIGIGTHYHHQYVPDAQLKSLAVLMEPQKAARIGFGSQKLHGVKPSHEMHFAHTIDKVQFGEHFPGMESPLAGTSQSKLFMADEHDGRKHLPAEYTYDLQLIPTVYEAVSGPDSHSHQYSVAEFVKKAFYSGLKGEPISPRAKHRVPSISFSMIVSPFTVQIMEEKRSWVHFATEVCAILGGVFSFSGLLDTFIFKIHNKVFQRRLMI